MVIIYEELPKPKRARKAWQYFTNYAGKEPTKMWFNPNAWGLGKFTADYWGFWVAYFEDYREYLQADPKEF